MQSLAREISAIIAELYNDYETVVLTRPDEQFGDYATNVALRLAGKLKKAPRDVAEQIVAALQKKIGNEISRVVVAGPGFINIAVSDRVLLDQAQRATEVKPAIYRDKVVVAEYGDPNPFKVLHAGHLYTDVVGDAVANLLESSGAQVHRVNFGGDVGLHVGKCMWAILHELGGEHPEKLNDVPAAERAEWLTTCYVKGNQAYEQNEEAKAEIIALNKRVYQLHDTNDHETSFAHIYWTCRQWSYDYFAYFYGLLGSTFEKYYPESENAALGLKTVQEQLQKGVYEKSDGAIIFRGEPYGLHTRVFVNNEGLPTYEAKDVGLIMAKWRDYHFDTSLVITGNDIIEYMKVVLKSIEQFMPELAERTVHLTHGMVKLAGGMKMSSRKGNILRATDILDAAADAAKKGAWEGQSHTIIAAVKYSFLKQRIGGDIIYDPAESVSIEGNSGPYLQYAHARARSILSKAKIDDKPAGDLQPGERSLARKISEYPEVLQQAIDDLMPHHICTYLYELAQAFNRFYEHNRVVGDEREATRLLLVTHYAAVLADGLHILGIEAPEHM